MRPTIDYLNARRDAKPASGGRVYANVRNAADDRAAFAGLDYHEQCMSQADAIIADFRVWFRNLPAISDTETECPF